MALIITLLFMGILGGSEVDIFVPSFPELQIFFELSPFMVELTLSLNLIAHCITSLLVGNMGDRYGRRPVILYGLVIFIAGSIACVWATAYWQLLLGRVLQGIGISGPVVLSFVVLADTYSAEKQQKLLGVLNGIMSMAMAFAPVVGSYINLYYGWRGNFAALLLLSLVCLALGMIFLPAGQKNHTVSLSLREYKSVFTSWTAIYFIATVVLFLQGYWVFIGMSPIFYMEELGVSLKQFGFYQGALAAIFALISFTSGVFIKKFGQKKCFFTSCFFLLIFTLCLPVLIILNVRDPLIITAAMCINSLGIIFPLNILWPLMLEAVPDAKGRLSAVCIASRLLVTAFSIMLASKLYDGTLRSLGSVITGFTLLSFWAGYKLFQNHPVFEDSRLAK